MSWLSAEGTEFLLLVLIVMLLAIFVIFIKYFSLEAVVFINPSLLFLFLMVMDEDFLGSVGDILYFYLTSSAS